MNFPVSTGLPANIAGIPVAQTSGEVNRARADAAAQRRTGAAEAHAEKAAGIGEADGKDHQTDERDADGRRPWEIPRAHEVAIPPVDDAFDQQAEKRQSRDATGESGGQLDLTG